ncbi:MULTISPECIES: hypothetical protein [unclassified Streptomyces]|nr:MULTISPECIES: hypothetical protein [unclassified Streptomyces]WSW11153.1 hypothetical protein OG298_43635 [Streptomyces sp. NBC_01005]WTB61081.1 hypothetical protein OG832_49775 [Streptomyces sp. NBC_00826]WTD00661.1 hypothetical protein OH736_43640 [Streptomyces sp. NBC_01650]WTH96222.1 hypothetical protein OIC43_45300 [Streptomyces sp. NBC_00825]WTI04755.1 hypothetical protein OHA23_44340 [Streptomyces sp. NBC_00822]
MKRFLPSVGKTIRSLGRAGITGAILRLTLNAVLRVIIRALLDALL